MPRERALLAALTMAGFDWLQSVGTHLQKRAEHAEALEAARHAEEHCDDVGRSWEKAQGGVHANPSLLAAFVRMHRQGLDLLHSRRAQARQTAQRERDAHAALVNCQHRERALCELLQAERRRIQMRRQALELRAVDELWLARSAEVTR